MNDEDANVVELKSRKDIRNSIPQFHESPNCGHQGINRTFNIINFFFSNFRICYHKLKTILKLVLSAKTINHHFHQKCL